MQNFDEQAEKYLGAVEKQKESEGKAGEGFTRGDMETCFVSGAQSMEVLQEGCEGTFGQAVGSLKRGFLVRREGWNGKGMWLWLKQETMVKSEWCHDLALKAIADQNGGEIHALGTICMKTADNKILTGWLASQTDMISEDWVLVDPNNSLYREYIHNKALEANRGIVSSITFKASDLGGCIVQTPQKRIGYLEHKESKTRIPVFKHIGWFHRCMLRWCFGVKYTKED